MEQFCSSFQKVIEFQPPCCTVFAPTGRGEGFVRFDGRKYKDAGTDLIDTLSLSLSNPVPREIFKERWKELRWDRLESWRLDKFAWPQSLSWREREKNRCSRDTVTRVVDLRDPVEEE